MKVQIGNKVYVVPQGVEVKIIDEPQRKFKVGDYVLYCDAIYKITDIAANGYRVSFVAGDLMFEYTTIGFLEEGKMEKLETYWSVMCEWGSAHDLKVLAQINYIWNTNRELFGLVLKRLYRRDIDEITDNDAFQCPGWLELPEYKKGCDTGDWTDYNKAVLRRMIDAWEFYAETYLSHIADDGDLGFIIDVIETFGN